MRAWEVQGIILNPINTLLSTPKLWLYEAARCKRGYFHKTTKCLDFRFYAGLWIFVELEILFNFWINKL